jgi:hypothetical protein
MTCKEKIIAIENLVDTYYSDWMEGDVNEFYVDVRRIVKEGEKNAGPKTR